MDDHVSAPKKPSDSDKSSGGRTAGTALLVPLFLFMALMWFREAIREHPVTFEASRYENFSNRGLSFQYKLTNTTKKPIEVVDVETRFRVKGQEEIGRAHV